MNRWGGVLASIVTAHPGLAAVIQALVTLRPAEPDDTSSAKRTLDLDTAHRGLQQPGRWMTYQRDLVRTVTRLSWDGPPTATFSNCRAFRCAMGAFAATGAGERLRDSVHAACSSRLKTSYDLEPRYGIEP